jgi:hypothetical protein
MSPIMSKRRAESSLEISRQLGPRARLLKPAPRRAPDGRLEGEQCPYCHYPHSNTCTILSACTVPPARTRSRSDPQAGASSGHSATSPPTMRGRRPAVADMPSPARQPRAKAPAKPITPGQLGPGTHRHCHAHAGQPHAVQAAPRLPSTASGPAATRRNWHRTDAASPRSPTPIRPGRRSSPGPMKGSADEDPSSQDHDAPAAGGQAPDHLVDSHDRPYRDDDRQRGLTMHAW